jgi:DnaK suppressor protein
VRQVNGAEGLSGNPSTTILPRFIEAIEEPGWGSKNVSTTTATQSKSLTKKELKKFQELLEDKRKVVLERARQMLSEGMVLDANDLPDEMDLASSEYIQSFEFRLRGREKSLLSKLDLALKKIEDGSFGICEICDEPIGKKRLEARPETSLCIKCKEDQEREERTMG